MLDTSRHCDDIGFRGVLVREGEVGDEIVVKCQMAANSIPMDPSKTLQELEGEDWGEPTYESGLVTQCHRLRRIPLRELTDEGLRILIGQQIGLVHLLPMTFHRLRSDPFISGDLYEGALLSMVLRIEGAFWGVHPQWYVEAEKIAQQALSELKNLDEDERSTAEQSLNEGYAIFKQRVPSANAGCRCPLE